VHPIILPTVGRIGATAYHIRWHVASLFSNSISGCLLLRYLLKVADWLVLVAFYFA